MARQAKSEDCSQQQLVYTTDDDLLPGKPIISKSTELRECSTSRICLSSSSGSKKSRVSSTRAIGDTSSSISARTEAGKRKLSDNQEDARKRQRTLTPDSSRGDQVVNGTKRKALEEDNRPCKRKRQECSTSSSKTDTVITDEEASRLEFETHYEQMKLLGQGGYGSVYAGLRRSDNVPVAIKHISRDSTRGEGVSVDGRMVPLEVAVMMKIGNEAAAAGGKSAAISLLDYYDLDRELILVLERPDPCVDLLDYIEGKGGTLQEEEAKEILKQLVKAAQELQMAEVFHRDIKTQNILMETGTEAPRARLIDFGLSCFAKEDSSFDVNCGTAGQYHPEFYQSVQYKPEPATVWQLGIVLFEMLHEDDFDTISFFKKELTIRQDLSQDCQSLLRHCLRGFAEKRPSLEQILCHPWLQ